MIHPLLVVTALLLATAPLLRAAEDRDAKVRDDLKEVQSVGHWIYNDTPGGFAEAARTGKPLLVVFRCIP
ncbi:MAG: hypothetical protein ACYDH9_08985 [Limisphaerales bacterium]